MTNLTINSGQFEQGLTVRDLKLYLNGLEEDTLICVAASSNHVYPFKFATLSEVEVTDQKKVIKCVIVKI